jgi:hypothetical protein
MRRGSASFFPQPESPNTSTIASIKTTASARFIIKPFSYKISRRSGGACHNTRRQVFSVWLHWALEVHKKLTISSAWRTRHFVKTVYYANRDTLKGRA